MTQATFDFGRLDWRFIKSGKNWGCWEASHGVWKCSINARRSDGVCVAISNLKRLITPVFELRPNVDEAKRFCQDWLLNGGAR